MVCEIKDSSYFIEPCVTLLRSVINYLYILLTIFGIIISINVLSNPANWTHRQRIRLFHFLTRFQLRLISFITIITN